MKVFIKKFVWIIIGIVVLAAIAWAFVPRPIDVDVVPLERGPMRVTVDQDGKTRVKERYVISAPLAGRLSRITLDEGDEVIAGQTLLASIVPTPPELLDVRAREQAEARVRAAEASLAQSEPMIARADAQLRWARIELERVQGMARDAVVGQEELDEAQLNVSVREAEVKAANFGRDIAQFQLEQARAALARTSPGSNGSSGPAASPVDNLFEIVSPVSGRVLRVTQESEATVTPGTQLIEIADVSQIEAVIDVLSRDAVNIRPGAPVMLERWGGGEPLRGNVRRVEPSGFTKISALGVEEQRVNVIVDLTDPAQSRATLGDGFRVDARIVVWEKPDVLKIPTGALFRDGADWSTWVIKNDHASRQRLRLGKMNALEAEVIDGLNPTDVVILHATDKIKEGVAVRPRSK